MAPDERSPFALFHAFPEPVLLVRGDGLGFANPAAHRLFPGLEEGAPLPPQLSALLDGAEAPAVLTGRLWGVDYQVTVQDAGDGALVVLRAQTGAGPGPALDRLCAQLRQETSSLSAALQRLGRGPAEEDPDKTRRYLAVANRGIYRLLRLVDEMEFTERPDEGLCRPAPLDLAGFCAHLSDQVSGLCAAAGVRFGYESQLSSLPTTVDAALLRRMLLSLCSNAIRAAGPGGEAGLRLQLRKGRAVLTVWDKGPGLAEHDFAGLFDDGKPAPLLPKPGEGLGLGLPMVRRIAGLLGGAVMVESRPNAGFRAVVALPVRPPEGGLPLRSPAADGYGGFSPLLVELSDVLPPEAYAPEETD